MAMAMTVKIRLFGIIHSNTMLGDNKVEKCNVVIDHETIQSNKICRYRRPT